MMRSVLIAAGLAAAASPALAQPNTFTTFDLARAESLAETLVICDRARLYADPPNPHAHRVYVRVDASRFELALPPDFTRPGGWYDEDVEHAYYRLKQQGLVTRAEVDAAQVKYVAPQLRRMQSPSFQERAFLQDQSRACRGVIRQVGRR